MSVMIASREKTTGIQAIEKDEIFYKYFDFNKPSRRLLKFSIELHS